MGKVKTTKAVGKKKIVLLLMVIFLIMVCVNHRIMVGMGLKKAEQVSNQTIRYVQNKLEIYNNCMTGSQTESLDALFEGMLINQNGYLLISRDNEIVAANRKSVKEQEATKWEELCKSGKVVKDNLKKIRYNGKRWYICEETYQDYKIYLLLSVNEIYRPYYIIELVFVIGYFALCGGAGGIANYFERKNYNTLKKSYDIIEAESKLYIATLLVDVKNGGCEWIKISDRMRQLFSDKKQIDAITDMVADRYVREEYREEYLKFTDIHTLSERMRGKESISFTYENITGEWIANRIVVQQAQKTGDIDSVLYLISNATEEIKKEKEYQKQLEQKTEDLEYMLKKEREYGGIMSVLSRIYWQIYSVDLENDTYIEIYNGKEFRIANLYQNGVVQQRFVNAVTRFVADEHKDSMLDFLNHATISERLKYVDSISTDYCTKSGMWMSASYITQQRDESGKVIKALFTIREIGEQKQKEFEQQENLKEAADVADAANRAKTVFLFNMSHDIRTPLNGIIGLLKINKTHFEDKELVYANHDKMLVAADHLLSLINDVLQMSKLEDRTIELVEECLSLEDLLKEVGTIAEIRASEAEISIESGKCELKVPYIYGSQVHLQKIFLNIYGNCIKYNKKGGSLRTDLECLGIEQGVVTYRWTISDTGIGMSEEFLKHIFEPFVQESQDARSVYQGTGLGMAIVKRLIDIMNGTIEIYSKKGIGSTFVITLPFKIAEKPEESKEIEDKAASEASIAGLHLMLVEDNELNAEIAETFLKDEEALITTVNDGRQAVELFAQSEVRAFDAILMDVMMPVMNGMEATKAIRRMDRLDAKEIPIIAMTANAFKEDEEQCLKAGMNAHLAKPLNMEEVISTISYYCEMVKKSREEEF